MSPATGQETKAAAARAATQARPDLEAAAVLDSLVGVAPVAGGRLMRMNESPFTQRSYSAWQTEEHQIRGELGSSLTPFILAKRGDENTLANAAATEENNPIVSARADEVAFEDGGDDSEVSPEQTRHTVVGQDVPPRALEGIVFELENLIAEVVSLGKPQRRKTDRPLIGLGSLRSLEHFASNVGVIQRDWGTLRTPDARTIAIGKVGSGELSAVGVPGFLSVNKEPLSYSGYFAPADWSLTIKQAIVETCPLSKPDAAELADTLLHESRHAEQRFVAARFAASLPKREAKEVAKEVQIPEPIASQAVAKKFDSQTDADTRAFGVQMFDAYALHGMHNQALINSVLSEFAYDGPLARKRKRARRALRRLRRRATPRRMRNGIKARDELKMEIEWARSLYREYLNIPFEFDAFSVENAAAEASGKGE